MFFLVTLKKKLKKMCASHMLKGHMSLLYVDSKKFPTNQFVKNMSMYFLQIFV